MTEKECVDREEPEDFHGLESLRSPEARYPAPCSYHRSSDEVGAKPRFLSYDAYPCFCYAVRSRFPTGTTEKTTMAKLFLIIGALNAALTVMLGAFAAHGLKAQLSEYSLSVFQTGVQYHFYHALGLLLVGLIAQQNPATSGFTVSGWLMVAGIVIFSGSLYVLAITDIRWLGAITPVGGVCFIASWLWLGWTLWKQ